MSDAEPTTEAVAPGAAVPTNTSLPRAAGATPSTDTLRAAIDSIVRLEDSIIEGQTSDITSLERWKETFSVHMISGALNPIVSERIERKRQQRDTTSGLVTQERQLRDRFIDERDGLLRHIIKLMEDTETQRAEMEEMKKEYERERSERTPKRDDRGDDVEAERAKAAVVAVRIRDIAAATAHRHSGIDEQMAEIQQLSESLMAQQEQPQSEEESGGQRLARD